MFVVGFNGPPKCGKDSIAQCVRTMLDLESDAPTFLDHLARPMREAAMMLAGYDPKDFNLYNRIKDEPQAQLGGDTIRHLMIQLSENFMKKKYGKDYWGRNIIQQNGICRTTPGIIFIPDVGFSPEIDVLERTVGPQRVLIFQVERPKTTWAGDSRSYCRGSSDPHRLINDSTILAAAEVVRDWIKTYGWLI